MSYYGKTAFKFLYNDSIGSFTLSIQCLIHIGEYPDPRQYVVCQK